MITTDDFVLFCGRTIDGMARAIGRLDDETVNLRPDLESANTPFQLVTHALGACTWWTEHIVCGLDVERDRDAEFTATGTVDELLRCTTESKRRLDELAPTLEQATAVHGSPRTSLPLGREWTVGAALIHAYEELAQHLGHLEITVDLLTADR